MQSFYNTWNKFRRKLEDAGPTLKRTKCRFADKYHIVDICFLKMALWWFVQESLWCMTIHFPWIKKIKGFLGLCYYYRKFVNSFSIIASPLNQHLQKNIAFEWTPDCVKPFDALKMSLSTAPVLVLSCPNHSLLPVMLLYRQWEYTWTVAAARNIQ